MRDPLWIFGYGSLVWRPAFEHVERQPAWIAGWARRFWQGSTDHRGVPGAPGRVVTLHREADATCWGMVYRVHPDQADAVLAELDHRERGGYERIDVRARFAHGRGEAPALAWIATPENANYLGPASLQAIAAQVRGAAGPSGANPEYVLRLAEALREAGADDPHVFALEALVRGEG